MEKQLKIALPKGRLLANTAQLLDNAGWGVEGYVDGAKIYRLKSSRFPDLMGKIFHERDIPIQVAVGNYDIGICGLDWVEELVCKYSSSPIVMLRKLDYGRGSLYMSAAVSDPANSIDTIFDRGGCIRLATEYPNLAEQFALKNRLRRFSVFPLWGATEAYPPESAELALISERDGEKALNHSLKRIAEVLSFQACVIVNRDSWEKKDLSELLALLEGSLNISQQAAVIKQAESGAPPQKLASSWRSGEGDVCLAIADGHQQPPTAKLLAAAGFQMDDYPSKIGNRRPTSSLEGVSIKVIRPQDMPMQVANGNFDLAITGIDWMTDHLIQFPSSPVMELLDLKYAWVKIVAVVANEVPVEDIAGLRQYYAARTQPIKIAAEYTNIADRYARENHLGFYKVIPTWGATEVFLPEDADMLIENTETGGSLARHNLKIIDTLFESTGRLICNKNSLANPQKSKKIHEIVELFKKALASMA